MQNIANIELKKFKKTLDMVLDCVFMFDANTFKLLYVNQGVIKQLGYDQNELLNMTLLDINPYLTKKQIQQFLTPLVERSIPSCTLETIHQHKNTTLIQVEAFFQYIQEEDFFVAIVRNITERKRTEAKLQQDIKKAENTKKIAELANQAKTAFLANISHELRTPLNGILGYTQILKRDKKLTNKQRDNIQIIHRSGEHLLMLINDILDLSKIEAGKLNIIPIDFYLPGFLQDIADLIKMRATQKGLDFEYEILHPLPIAVRADEKRLRQVLLNLLSNAVKFTNEGIISLRVIYYNGRVRFEVEDTGIGVPNEHLETIFSSFHQIGHQHHQGTGLGLSISKQLVEMMEGKLLISSLLGNGSIFWFDIPMTEIQAADDVYRPYQHETIIGYTATDETNSPFKILLVDEIWQNRTFLVSLLKNLGFIVLEASNGKEALDLTIKNLPNVIITDLIVPYMNDFELVQEIRKLTQLQKVIIFATSADVFEQQQQKSLEIGCDEFIAKPVDTEALLTKLQKHLPLKWDFDNENSKEASEDVDIVGPSAEQAAILLKLILGGNVKKIINNVNQLEQQQPQLTPFSNEVKKLVRNFAMSELKQFIKLYT
ncbi:ATP-binding protein [Candidatus Halobeggiatoa sp. HSG11]|nr:ATP-binding protein [Candidatus Halobeggiatoa sp. HSG11]